MARLDAREGVVRAGRVEGWHDAVESSAYSPGGRWGYIARDGDSLVVMVNGRVAARGQWGAHFAFRRGARHQASGVAASHAPSRARRPGGALVRVPMYDMLDRMSDISYSRS